MEIHLFENINTKLEQLNEKQKNILFDLKDKILNEIPIIGSFCVNKCFLVEVTSGIEYIEYTLCFLKEDFMYKEGIPQKVISREIVCCKQYLNKEILIIASEKENFIKSALGIMLNMPNYIKLKLNSEFSYTQFKAKELSITIEELKVIQGVLEERLVIHSEIIKGERVTIIDFLNHDNVYEDKIYGLKTTPIKGKKKALEFYYFNDERKKNRLMININGIIYSDILVNKKAMDEIVLIIYIILKNQKAKNLLVPINKIMDEYCSFIHKDMLIEGKIRHRNLIINELYHFINIELENNNLNVEVNETYITIILNLFLNEYSLLEVKSHSSIINNNTEDDTLKENVDVDDFQNLISFIKKYSLKKYNKTVDEEGLRKIFTRLGSAIKLSKGEVKTLINTCQSTCRL